MGSGEDTALRTGRKAPRALSTSVSMGATKFWNRSLVVPDSVTGENTAVGTPPNADGALAVSALLKALVRVSVVLSVGNGINADPVPVPKLAFRPRPIFDCCAVKRVATIDSAAAVRISSTCNRLSASRISIANEPVSRLPVLVAAILR